MSMQKPDSSEKTVSARRRLLQAFAVGGTAAVVLPEKWVKPVIDAVIVPAHASGSVVPIVGTYGNSGNPVMGNNGSGNFLDRFAGMLIGSAYATGSLPACGLVATSNACISFAITAGSANNVSVLVNCPPNAWDFMTVSRYPNNSIDDVTLPNSGYSFTNLVVNSIYLNGMVSKPNCASEAFSFPRASACTNPA